VKILVFSWKDIKHPWAGGSEVNIQEQAKRWVEEGHQVTMFTTRFKGLPRRDWVDGIDVYRAGGRFTIYLLAPIAYLLFLRHRADVILDIINGIPFFTPAFSRRPIVALVHHVHTEMFVIELGPVVGRFGRFVERYLVPLLYRNKPFICVSESTASAMRTKLYKGDMLDITVIHNGISLDHYHPGRYSEFERPTVLYLGRLKKYKQLPTLIRIMVAVHGSVPDAELLMVGWGDAVVEAKEVTRRAGASDYIRYVGFVSDEEKCRYYQQAWVLATASMVEGWGLTVIEANACGTPAVAFDVPGLNESIVSGQTGFLAADEAEFVARLTELLTDDALRRSMAEGAGEWSSRFSWDAAAASSLEILKKAAGK
jgi:glycosyltransferase involved in cell wall biosynthesis